MYKKVSSRTTEPTWMRSGRDYTRQMVRVRDKHQCQWCKRKWDGVERRFDVHHLNGQCGKKSRKYDRISDLPKLVTLCHRCHLSVHVVRDRFRKRNVLKSHREQIAGMRKVGVPYDQIAKKFRVSYAAVYFFLNGRKKKGATGNSHTPRPSQ